MPSTGKKELFLNVIEQHKGILYKVAHIYGQHTEDREDLVQEMIFQLWRSFDRFTNTYKYSTLIYRVALNTAISFYRKERRRKQVHLPLTGIVPVVEDLAQPGEKEEDLRLLQAYISGLKDLDKALILLYLEEKTYKEIAEITGITETNVATKISRIKTGLKQKFLIVKK